MSQLLHTGTCRLLSAQMVHDADEGCPQAALQAVLGHVGSNSRFGVGIKSSIDSLAPDQVVARLRTLFPGLGKGHLSLSLFPPLPNAPLRFGVEGDREGVDGAGERKAPEERGGSTLGTDGAALGGGVEGTLTAGGGAGLLKAGGLGAGVGAGADGIGCTVGWRMGAGACLGGSGWNLVVFPGLAKGELRSTGAGVTVTGGGSCGAFGADGGVGLKSGLEGCAGARGVAGTGEGRLMPNGVCAPLERLPDDPELPPEMMGGEKSGALRPTKGSLLGECNTVGAAGVSGMLVAVRSPGREKSGGVLLGAAGRLKADVFSGLDDSVCLVVAGTAGNDGAVDS